MPLRPATVLENLGEAHACPQARRVARRATQWKPRGVRTGTRSRQGRQEGTDGLRVRCWEVGLTDKASGEGAAQGSSNFLERTRRKMLSPGRARSRNGQGRYVLSEGLVESPALCLCCCTPQPGSLLALYCMQAPVLLAG